MTTPTPKTGDTTSTATEEFEVLLVSDERDHGFAVFCPSLPGCNSQGDDREHALAMITEAIEGFLLRAPRQYSVDGRRERLMAEYTADGCTVEVATVRVEL